VGSLERRIEWLEGRSGPEQCPECGHHGNSSNIGYEIVWEDVEPLIEDPEKLKSLKNKYCGTCGQAVELVVGWGEAPD
jgi:hypothetical protein